MTPYSAFRTGRSLLPAAGAALLVAALPAAGATAGSQEHQHVHTSPYAGQPPSGIAALTVEELQELESGDGMGLARAGELNHFPGPKHVLEMADLLELTAEQRQQVDASRERMLAEATRLGDEIIAQERILNARFAHAHVDADTMRELTARIGALRGQLRATHLLAHLETRAVLTEAQVHAYDVARGYAPADAAME